MLSVDYQLNNDIDWFCILGNIPIHVASNGGRLPVSLSTVSKLRTAQRFVYNLDENCDYEFNPNVLEMPLNDSLDEIRDISEYFPFTEGLFEERYLSNSQKAYLWSFVKMAKKGFYSYDRIDDTDKYMLIAWPKKDKDYQDLSEQLRGIVPEYSYEYKYIKTLKGTNPLDLVNTINMSTQIGKNGKK